MGLWMERDKRATTRPQWKRLCVRKRVLKVCMNESSRFIESYKLRLKRTLCSLRVSDLVNRREAGVRADNLRMRRVTGMFIQGGPETDLRVCF